MAFASGTAWTAMAFASGGTAWSAMALGLYAGGGPAVPPVQLFASNCATPCLSLMPLTTDGRRPQGGDWCAASATELPGHLVGAARRALHLSSTALLAFGPVTSSRRKRFKRGCELCRRFWMTKYSLKKKRGDTTLVLLLSQATREPHPPRNPTRVSVKGNGSKRGRSLCPEKRFQKTDALPHSRSKERTGASSPWCKISRMRGAGTNRSG